VSLGMSLNAGAWRVRILTGSSLAGFGIEQL
jgi:hypothetical protein